VDAAGALLAWQAREPHGHPAGGKLTIGQVALSRVVHAMAGLSAKTPHAHCFFSIGCEAAMASEHDVNSTTRAEAFEKSSDFTRESRDQVWADRMTQAIQSSLGGVLATGTAIDTVECQSIFCRVTVSHANEAARQTLLASVPRTRSGLPRERGCAHWTRTSPRRQWCSCRAKSVPAPKRAESVAAAVVLGR
jgi:hypothetical protein